MKKIFVLILIMTVLVTGCMPGSDAITSQTTSAASTAASAVERSSFQYPETGPIIRLSYNPALVGTVEGGLAAAVANTPDQPYFAVHPAFIQLRFPKLGKSQRFQLPYPIDGPQMILYRTQDFAGYAKESSRTFPNQLNGLKDLLEKGIHPDHCAKPLASDSQGLPLLPVVNSAQIFCAKVQLVSFEDGKGLRYITYYSQEVSPAIEWFAFYTFQGLSNDGKYYLSVILPIRTNILPSEPPTPPAKVDINALETLLEKQVSQINAQADDRFTPSLTVLDALIAGVNILGE